MAILIGKIKFIRTIFQLNSNRSFLRFEFNWKMVRMNFIFIFMSSSDTNLLQKKSVKQKIKKQWPYKIEYYGLLSDDNELTLNMTCVSLCPCENTVCSFKYFEQCMNLVVRPPALSIFEQ